MDPRARYLEALLFGQPDHVPLMPGAPRESTLAMWRQQGLPQAGSYLDHVSEALGVPREAFDGRRPVPECFRMAPTFEEKVIEHKDGHYIVQDWMGAITEIDDRFDYTYIRSAKDFVTRKWHRFPVQGPEDWEKVAWRYDAHDPKRIPCISDPVWHDLATSGRAVTVSVNGPFWQMREWVGMEPLCLMMVEQPAFVAQMAAFWQRFTLEVLETLLRRVRVDALMVSEDMAYKAHSMISPAMARRFLQPTYTSWRELLCSYDVPLFDMDSDGYIAELVPIWVSSGINCCNPIEVAAGNDVVAYRRAYGRSMAYHGGTDKRAIAAGGDTMRAEVMRVVPPLFAEGGYIPGCDHGVPPDISHPDYLAYARLLAQLEGWL